jgi:hypothetical protein
VIFVEELLFKVQTIDLKRIPHDNFLTPAMQR